MVGVGGLLFPGPAASLAQALQVGDSLLEVFEAGLRLFSRGSLSPTLPFGSSAPPPTAALPAPLLLLCLLSEFLRLITAPLLNIGQALAEAQRQPLFRCMSVF